MTQAATITHRQTHSPASSPSPAVPAPACEATPTATAPDWHNPQATRRAQWMKTLMRWHWISSALCLVGMLMFAATGLTLNNAGVFESAQPSVQQYQATVPTAMRTALRAHTGAANAALPTDLRDWLSSQWQVRLPILPAQWSAAEITLDMPRPGVDALLRIDLASGQAEMQTSDRGWIAYVNDLHKGRHAGTTWSWFLDLFAAACLVFSVTGLLILQLHAKARPMVWPVTALGLVIPMLLAMLFIH